MDAFVTDIPLSLTSANDKLEDASSVHQNTFIVCY